jgi:hypothetical protein
VSNQRSTGRLERRAERDARNQNAEGPRGRRARPEVRKVDSGSGLPGPLKNFSGTTLGIAAIGVFVVAFLIYAVTQTGQGDELPGWLKAQRNDDPNLPGQYFAPHPGADGQIDTRDDRDHFATGTVIPICTPAQLEAADISDPVCYTSNPPTSGPHADQPMPFRVLENPAPKENLLHSMEHGGVIVWYNTSNQDMINQLEDLVQEQIDRRRFVALTQYPSMEADTIAITAWTRLDKFPVADYNKKRLEDFINEHHKRFNPEGF